MDMSYYHGASRYVRRCFLCSVKQYSRKSYEDKRDCEDKLMFFSVDVDD
jgi:hypothetical protein